jgi:glyoxylate reductase
MENVAEVVVSLCYDRAGSVGLTICKHMESASRDELFQDLAPGGKYADIVGIYHEHESSHKTGLPDRQMVYALPQSVKWIAHKGAGYDQFDVVACKERGSEL